MIPRSIAPLYWSNYFATVENTEPFPGNQKIKVEMNFVLAQSENLWLPSQWFKMDPPVYSLQPHLTG